MKTKKIMITKTEDGYTEIKLDKDKLIYLKPTLDKLGLGLDVSISNTLYMVVIPFKDILNEK